jgi:hypothetical protein
MANGIGPLGFDPGIGARPEVAVAQAGRARIVHQDVGGPDVVVVDVDRDRAGRVDGSRLISDGLLGLGARGRISPTPAAFKAAATQAEWSPAQGFQVTLVDEPGRESWPMVATSYFLLRRDRFEQPVALAVRRFVRWSITSDATQIDTLGYVPLPRSVIVTLEGILSK